MNENNEIRDTGAANSSDVNNDTGRDCKVDYGGKLAKDTGVDLNVSTTDSVSVGKVANNDVGEDLNKNRNQHLDSSVNKFDPEQVLSAGIDIGKKMVEAGIDIGANFANAMISIASKSVGKVKIENTPSDSSPVSKEMDITADSQQLDVVLDNFQENKWNELSLEEQKQSMTDLADYVAADTGNENPPKIAFRDDMPDGSYGGYNPETNTLDINENMLDDSTEAADTVAHEMWHAYQQQCALDPASEQGREYQEGFDNYISPEYDFEGYENQMVEAEAREYAQGFKNRLKKAA